MKNALLKWITLLVLLGPMQAWAAPITYDIGFTADGGDAPTGGEFTYDEDSEALHGLSVTWEGFTFDNFATGNVGLCGAGDTGAFNLLSRACPGVTHWGWFGSTVPVFDEVWFVFSALVIDIDGRTTHLDILAATITAETIEEWIISGRVWDITRRTTEVPEPGTLALLGMGLAGLGFTRRRRKTTQV